MPDIQIHHSLEHIATQSTGLHLAMGVFDGVHKGHQEVIKEAIHSALSENGESGVLTFDPFPIHVLAPDRAPSRILVSIEHKAKLLADLGVQHLFVLPFDHDFAKQSAVEFLGKLTHTGNLKGISVGEDWKFGKGREGSLEMLKQYCSSHQITLAAKAPVMFQGERISSTRIRQAVRDGNLNSATKMLGRPYSLFGEVVEGNKIGRTIGYPTANIETGNELLPPNGVYCVQTQIDHKQYFGVANLGTRPTINDEKKRTFEVHLFDFDQEIYGRELIVELGQFIRGEQKFDNIETLVKQIKHDAEQAKALISSEEAWFTAT